MKTALAIAAAWQGATGTIVVDLNTGLVSKRMDGVTLTGLVQAYQSGALTLSAFLQALADDDIVPQSAANAA